METFPTPIQPSLSSTQTLGNYVIYVLMKSINPNKHPLLLKFAFQNFLIIERGITHTVTKVIAQLSSPIKLMSEEDGGVGR